MFNMLAGGFGKIAQRGKGVFSPISILATQKRQHHYKTFVDAKGVVQVKHIRAHTAAEAKKLGVTKEYANRHLAEIKGNSSSALSPNTMEKIAQKQAQLRGQGIGLPQKETRKKNTVIAFPSGSKHLPDLQGRIASKDVLGIATSIKGHQTPSINSQAVVKRNKNGQINHLDSSS